MVSLARRTKRAMVGLVVAATAMMGLASAQAREHQPAATTVDPVAAAATVSAEPQATTASFGDWVVRCVTAETPARRTCEASEALVVQNQGQQIPIAQIAFGRAGDRTAALQLTVTRIS